MVGRDWWKFVGGGMSVEGRGWRGEGVSWKWKSE